VAARRHGSEQWQGFPAIGGRWDASKNATRGDKCKKLPKSVGLLLDFWAHFVQEPDLQGTPWTNGFWNLSEKQLVADCRRV
jgi:hypothetical protein